MIGKRVTSRPEYLIDDGEGDPLHLLIGVALAYALETRFQRPEHAAGLACVESGHPRKVRPLSEVRNDESREQVRGDLIDRRECAECDPESDLDGRKVKSAALAGRKEWAILGARTSDLRLGEAAQGGNERVAEGMKWQ